MAHNASELFSHSSLQKHLNLNLNAHHEHSLFRSLHRFSFHLSIKFGGTYSFW